MHQKRNIAMNASRPNFGQNLQIQIVINKQMGIAKVINENHIK